MLKLPRLTLPTLNLKLPKLFSTNKPPRPTLGKAPVVSVPQPVYCRVEEVPPTRPRLFLGYGKDGSRFGIDPADFEKDGGRDAIFASSGMGKSYLTGLFVEQTIECGGLVYVIDPEGEYHTLAERYPVLIVGGRHANCGLSLDPQEVDGEIVDNTGDFRRLAETVLSEGLSVVFDLSERSEQNQQEAFIRIVGSLFSSMDSEELRRPIKLVVEEARIFAPQQSSNLAKIDGQTSLSILQHVATRGRKRGLDLLTATQRPAAISKDVISQCNRWWLGGVKSSRDCHALKPFLLEAGVTPEQIRALKPGQFYYYAGGHPVLIKTRRRKCRHAGSTPTATRTLPRVDNRKDLEAISKKISGQTSKRGTGQRGDQ